MKACARWSSLKKNADPGDFYMRTLKVGQVSEENFFGKTIHEDIMEILSDIRKTHVIDSTTADANASDLMLECIKDVRANKGTSEEQQVAFLLRKLGINYSKLTEAEFVIMMNIFQKSSNLIGGNRLKSRRSKKCKR